jgi:hypothetical protein
MEEEASAAELADRVMRADRPSTPPEKRLRLQWNVPQGVTPYVPLWLAGVFAFLVLFRIVDALLH